MPLAVRRIEDRSAISYTVGLPQRGGHIRGALLYDARRRRFTLHGADSVGQDGHGEVVQLAITDVVAPPEIRQGAHCIQEV